MKIFATILFTIISFLTLEVGLFFAVSWISNMFFNSFFIYVSLGVFVFINSMMYVFLRELTHLGYNKINKK